MKQINKLQQLLIDPLISVSLLIFLLWALFDFFSRFVTNAKPTVDNKQSVWDTSFNVTTINSEQQESILSLFEPYFKKDEKKIVAPLMQGLSEQDKLKQQGLIDTFFIDDKQLILKSVIKDNTNGFNKSFALFDVLDMKTGQKEIVQVAHDRSILGYKVQIASITQVHLSRLHLQKLQQVTLIMYKNNVS